MKKALRYISQPNALLNRLYSGINHGNPINQAILQKGNTPPQKVGYLYLTYVYCLKKPQPAHHCT